MYKRQEQFIIINQWYCKPNFIPIRHIVLSLDPYSYEDKTLPQQLAAIIDRFCLHVFANDYQVIYAIHEDEIQLHAHIMINTVNLHTRQLLVWDYAKIQEIYYYMDMFLNLNSHWKGKYPIKNLIMCFD